MGDTNYQPMWDAGDEVEPGAFTWLQAWYATQCDGEWEHDEGITIETLDNPGWHVRINLDGTPLDGKSYEGTEVYRAEHDWCTTRVQDSFFEGACGPLNMGEVLHAFRSWAQPLDPSEGSNQG